MLRISTSVHAEMVAHCWACLPLEACGLLAGDPGYHVGMYPSLIVLASPALALLWRITGDNFRATFDGRSAGDVLRLRFGTRR